ncbi:MAG: hypothetical protein ABIR10_00170 [Dokdonella sp.]
MLGHAHSWIAEAHLVLEDAQTQLGNAEAARAEHAEAAAIIAGLPAGHLLRRRIEESKPHKI